MFGLFNKAVKAGQRAFGIVGSTLKKFGDTGANVVRKIGNFVSEHHEPLTQVAHGLAMASGNETAQKITGALRSASGVYGVRQKLDNIKKQQEDARSRGGGGMWDIDNKRFV
jgi:hypothetical protein